MDVVDLDELAAEQSAAPVGAARLRVAYPARRLLRHPRLWGVVAGVLALVVLTGWAVASSGSPLSAQALGMRGGPEVGWTMSTSEIYGLAACLLSLASMMPPLRKLVKTRQKARLSHR